MRKVMTAAFALSALFAASGKVQAEVNYPWCIIGNTRAVDCYFSSREQCAQDGRNRGFGGQCIQNPAYKPGRPTVSVKEPTALQSTSPSRAVSAGHSTCTWMKSLCLSGERLGCLRMGGEGLVICGGGTLCDSAWEQCMKSGWWEAHIRAERR
jgi:hypothetical protein